MSLKGIKSKIRGVDKTHKVTKAMEAVSAVKMRKSQERALEGRPYAVAALSILERVGGSRDAMHHPLLTERPVKRFCVVLITSDKGLAGALNSSVIRNTESHIEKLGLEKDSVVFITVGKKGYEYFSKRGYTIVDNIENIDEAVTTDELRSVTEKVVELFDSKECDSCVIAYNQFQSTFEQSETVRRILPVSVEEIRKTVNEIVPDKGKYSDFKEEGYRGLYTVEPDHETVFRTLIPFLLQIEIYHSLLEAHASEHSARMVAMKNASDKASDLSKELTLSYNKARQAQITREVSEIIGGIEAMA